MPSLRKPLTIRQKLIALYTDPNIYTLADVVALMNGATPTDPDYRRHVTCFLLDVEARVHANRQKTQRNLTEDPQAWQLRRSWARQVTGRDILLSRPPSADDVRRWRERWIPSDTWVGVDYRNLPLPEAQARAEIEKLAHADNNIRTFVDAYGPLAVARARELGQFPQKKKRNLIRLHPVNVASADGTYVRAFSKVDLGEDLQTGDPVFLGNRNPKASLVGGKVHKTRFQKSVHREPKAGRDTMGVNHVAVLTRTKFGRVILAVERVTGGEVHAALKAMDRIAPLAKGGIYALTYDKALNGWQVDYLLARHGIISIAPPPAAKGALPEEKEAARAAEDILAARVDAAAAASRRPSKRGRG